MHDNIKIEKKPNKLYKKMHVIILWDRFLPSRQTAFSFHSSENWNESPSHWYLHRFEGLFNQCLNPIHIPQEVPGHYHSFSPQSPYPNLIYLKF